MKITNKPATTMLISLANGTSRVLEKVVSFEDYAGEPEPEEISHHFVDCASEAADLDRIKAVLDTQGKILIKTWNDAIVTGVRYTETDEGDDILLDNGQSLIAYCFLPRWEKEDPPSRVARAVYGFWEPDDES